MNRNFRSNSKTEYSKKYLKLGGEINIPQNSIVLQDYFLKSYETIKLQKTSTSHEKKDILLLMTKSQEQKKATVINVELSIVSLITNHTEKDRLKLIVC